MLEAECGGYRKYPTKHIRASKGQEMELWVSLVLSFRTGSLVQCLSRTQKWKHMLRDLHGASETHLYSPGFLPMLVILLES